MRLISVTSAMEKTGLTTRNDLHRWADFYCNTHERPIVRIGKRFDENSLSSALIKWHGLDTEEAVEE